MVNFQNVEVAHFPAVDEIDQGIIEKNFQHFLSKVAYDGGDPKLHITVKEYNKGGVKMH